MTDYHAEGVKLLAYVPARSLPSALTKSPLATAAPPTTTASQIFSLRSMTHEARHTSDEPSRGPFVRLAECSHEGARAPETTRSTDSLD